MTDKEKKKILSKVESIIKKLQDEELECMRKVAYMEEHNFKMEAEALRYKAAAYTESWLIVSSLQDNLFK